MQYKDQKEIADEINLAEIIVHASFAGTKEGNKIYNKWKRNKMSTIKEIREAKEMTVFDKLKKESRPKNLFDRLKQLKR